MATTPEIRDARAFRKQMKLALRAEAERLEREAKTMMRVARGLRDGERALTDKRRPRRPKGSVTADD